MQNINSTLQQAIVLHQQGKLTAAAQLYQQILTVDNKQSDAHNLLGAVYVATKNYKLAEKHLLKATKYAKNYAPAHYNLGKAYLDQQKHHLALAAFSKAVKLQPDYVDAIFLLANTRVQLGVVAQAQAGYEKVIKLSPDHFEAHNNLGSVLQDIGSGEASIPHHELAIALNPKFELAYLNLAYALAKLERHEDALAVFQSCINYCSSARLYQNLGTTLQQLGRMGEAQQAYLKTIELDSTMGSAYRNLAEITKVEANGKIDIKNVVQAGFDAPNMDEKSKMHLYFAWAKVNDGAKNYSLAFAAYKKGNDINRDNYKYSKNDSVELFTHIMSAYSESFLSETSNSGVEENKPIFILGMPRSGTTLVEQIISSHTDVTGAGELSYMGDQTKQYKGGMLAFHKRFSGMGPEKWATIAGAYLQGLNGYDEGKAHITDKMPHNFLNIGMISKLLPNAKIIHCKRHPVANCLSIYKAYFGAKNSHPYAYNLKELAHYHNLYEDLMDHWRAVLPGRFYEVSYEELTSNQEEQSRKLIEYCGLEWQDACLDFYKTDRKVKTASAFQVRQPMHNQSVDLWKRYGDALQPLLDDLYIPPEYQS
ncbi:MAG: sulfotransferase [Gammaproteobacteria bacterium]|nr:sulfotransferase [Gammaproteobacteria bacterium]